MRGKVVVSGRRRLALAPRILLRHRAAAGCLAALLLLAGASLLFTHGHRRCVTRLQQGNRPLDRLGSRACACSPITSTARGHVAALRTQQFAQ